MAQSSFKKRSPAGHRPHEHAVACAAPRSPSRWDDYFDTNQAAAPGARRARTAPSRPSSTASRSTRRVVRRHLVDDAPGRPDDLHGDRQASTPRGRCCWRVQAIDSDDNGLTWSDVAARSPRRARRSPCRRPSTARRSPGTTPFRWAPQAFASSLRHRGLQERRRHLLDGQPGRHQARQDSRPTPDRPAARGGARLPAGGCAVPTPRQQGTVVRGRPVQGVHARRRQLLSPAHGGSQAPNGAGPACGHAVARGPRTTP